MTSLFIDAVFPSREAFPGCTPVGLPLVPCAVVTWGFPPDKSTAGDQYLLASLTIKFSNIEVRHGFHSRGSHDNRVRTRPTTATVKPVRGPRPFPRTRTGSFSS
jgi:hypothetical protein